MAAYVEESVRAFRLRCETQLLPIEMLREAARDDKRRREHQDPLAWAARRGPSVEELCSRDPDDEGASEARGEAELTAASMGLQAHELNGSINVVEDSLIDMIDAKKWRRQ